MITLPQHEERGDHLAHNDGPVPGIPMDMHPRTLIIYGTAKAGGTGCEHVSLECSAACCNSEVSSRVDFS